MCGNRRNTIFGAAADVTHRLMRAVRISLRSPSSQSPIRIDSEAEFSLAAVYAFIFVESLVPDGTVPISHPSGRGRIVDLVFAHQPAD